MASGEEARTGGGGVGREGGGLTAKVIPASAVETETFGREELVAGHGGGVEGTVIVIGGGVVGGGG